MHAYPPVVIYHGLGDSCCDESTMKRFTNRLSQLRNATIYPIMIGSSPSQDRHRSFFDNADAQVREVCNVLYGKFKDTQIDAIGFSQGGLLMRAVVERCGCEGDEHGECIRVGRLLTLGSPHQGISSAPGCPTQQASTWCRIVNSLIKSRAYSSWVQSHVLPAQYYKDKNDVRKFHKHNRFLVDINQELEVNGRYKRAFGRLDGLYLYRFSRDTILDPSETSWFGWFDENGLIKGMKDHAIYERIGLEDLDRKGAIHFRTIIGMHMQIGQEGVEQIANDLS